MRHKPYTDFELRQIIIDTREVMDDPYKVFTAFAISSLKDAMLDDDEDLEDLWGMKVPQSVLEKLTASIAEDFVAAAKSRVSVSIFGKSYSIRRPNAFDGKRLPSIFSFSLDQGYYTIAKDGIMNLSEYEQRFSPETVKELRESREYFRKIVMVAEDDDNDGWDKLTDMEVGYYCWGLFFCKHLRDNLTEFYEIYKEHVRIPMSELEKGLNEKSRMMHGTNGLYSFSAKAIREWNTANGQHSIIDDVSADDAENYWYKNARNRFLGSI